MEDRELQMKALAELTRVVDERGIGVELVADEWCNTLDDIKYFADHKAGHMVQIKTPDLGGINNIVEAVLYCKRKKALSVSGRHLQRNRPLCTSLRQYCHGCAAGSNSGQTWYGRRRRIYDRLQ